MHFNLGRRIFMRVYWRGYSYLTLRKSLTALWSGDMDEVMISNWDEYEDVVKEYCGGMFPEYVLFRGAPLSKHDLRPSFAREFLPDPRESEAIVWSLEASAYRNFRREARHYLEYSLYTELREIDSTLQW